MEYDFKPQERGYYQFYNSEGDKTYKRRWDGVNWYNGSTHDLVGNSKPLYPEDIDGFMRSKNTYELIADENKNPVVAKPQPVVHSQLDLFD